jgi:hypothetical protein
MRRINTGKAMLASIELSDTQRVRNNTNIKTATQHKATFG